MLQLFAGMAPGGGVENTWERILELPTSVAIPGVLYHTFYFGWTLRSQVDLL